MLFGDIVISLYPVCPALAKIHGTLLDLVDVPVLILADPLAQFYYWTWYELLLITVIFPLACFHYIELHIS